MKDEDKGATAIRKFLEKFDEFPDTFDDGYAMFVRDHYLLNNFNSIMEAEIVAAYRPVNDPSKKIVGKGSIDLGNVTLYLVTRSGNIVKLTNSEWGQIKICGKV